MEVETFMFIPDLTGYTRYMSTTNSATGREIVEQLLKAMVKAENLGMTISDIEGDAIFFFKTGVAPSFKALLEQCMAIIETVEDTLDKCLEDHGAENKAARTAQRLGVKFVAHVGKVRLTEIGGHKQLIGKAVIEVHKLLKNSVPLDNYILVTRECVEGCSGSEGYHWLGMKGVDLFQHLGVIQYRAYDLDEVALRFR